MVKKNLRLCLLILFGVLLSLNVFAAPNFVPPSSEFQETVSDTEGDDTESNGPTYIAPSENFDNVVETENNTIANAGPNFVPPSEEFQEAAGTDYSKESIENYEPPSNNQAESDVASDPSFFDKYGQVLFVLGGVVLVIVVLLLILNNMGGKKEVENVYKKY
jgi:hypothetical protein